MDKKQMRVIELIAGVILMIPALLSIPLLIYAILLGDGDGYQIYPDLSNSIWTGNTEVYRDGNGVGGAGHTSAFPIYCGLMAIAGAYLIKDSESKK
jgi:hypothetical protein